MIVPPRSATPLQAAAVVAALERFLADHAPAAPTAGEAPSAWVRAARLEGVGHAPSHGWGDGHPWPPS